jgi:hypothetical protein
VIVRLTETEFLGSPQLWSHEGLSVWLRERGIDVSQAYDRFEGEHELVFTQGDDARHIYVHE